MYLTFNMSNKKYFAKVSTSSLLIMALISQAVMPAFAFSPDSDEECREAYTLCDLNFEMDGPNLRVDFRPYQDLGDANGYLLFHKEGSDFERGETTYRSGYRIQPKFIPLSSGTYYDFNYINNANHYFKLMLSQDRDGVNVPYGSKNSFDRYTVNYSLRTPELSYEDGYVVVKIRKPSFTSSGYSVFYKYDSDMMWDQLPEPMYFDRSSERGLYNYVRIPVTKSGKMYVKVGLAFKRGGEYARYERISVDSAYIDVDYTSTQEAEPARTEVEPARTETEPVNVDTYDEDDREMNGDRYDEDEDEDDREMNGDRYDEDDMEMNEDVEDQDDDNDKRVMKSDAYDERIKAILSDVKLPNDVSSMDELKDYIVKTKRELDRSYRAAKSTRSQMMKERDVLVEYKNLVKRYGDKMPAAAKRKAKNSLEKLAEIRKERYNMHKDKVEKSFDLSLKLAKALYELSELYSLDMDDDKANSYWMKAKRQVAKAYGYKLSFIKKRTNEIKNSKKYYKDLGEEVESMSSEVSENEDIITNSSEIGVEYEDVVLTPDNPFSDVSTSSEVGEAAVYLYNEGVIGGYKDGTFKDDQDVNRAEAAKFLYLAKYGEVSDMKNDGKFSDVLEGQWYVKYVIACSEKGIINGDPEGTFRPADKVNRAEFTKIVVETFGLEGEYDGSYSDVSKSDWYYKYLGAAMEYNLYPELGSEFNGSEYLTRGEVARAIYNVMSSM